MSGCKALEWLWGDTPCPRAKEKPRKTVGGAKSCLESNPIPTRDAQRAQTNLGCKRTQRRHRDWDRIVLECILWGMGQQWTAGGAGALGAVDLGRHKPSWRRLPLTYQRDTKTYKGLGKQTLAGHKQNLVCTWTQEKGTLTPQKTNPDLPVSVQETLEEMWVRGGLLQGWQHWVQQTPARELLKEVTIQRCPFHYRGLGCKSRKSRNTWRNRQIWPWSTEWSRAKANRVLPRECTGHSKHPFPTTQEKTLHMDITRWPTPKSDWVYSLRPKMEKLYTVRKTKTGSWLWLRSWTPYCQIQT